MFTKEYDVLFWVVIDLTSGLDLRIESDFLENFHKFGASFLVDEENRGWDPRFAGNTLDEMVGLRHRVVAITDAVLNLDESLFFINVNIPDFKSNLGRQFRE